MNKLFWGVFFFTLSVGLNASDVLISTDIGVGQGLLYKHNNVCYVVTPSHVIEGSKTLSGMTTDRKRYALEIEHKFDIDLALLTAKRQISWCSAQDFSLAEKLPTVLEIFEYGILKTKLGDGSTLQTKVDIIGVDNTEFLEIRTTNSDDSLKQGYSGGVLFVADQPAGVLIEVSEGSGYIYRADALVQKLKQHFPSNNQQTKRKAAEKPANEKFTGRLRSRGDVSEYNFVGQANSPVEFVLIPQSGSMEYTFHILDNFGNRVFRPRNFQSYQDDQFAFTPPKNGRYTIRLVGKRGGGSFGILIKQVTLDANLRGQGNVIGIGDSVSGRIAAGAVAEYKFSGTSKVPLEITLVPQAGSMEYTFHLLDRRGRALIRPRNYQSYQEVHIPFSPPQTGTYTIRLVGKRGHGSYGIQLWEGR